MGLEGQVSNFKVDKAYKNRFSKFRNVFSYPFIGIIIDISKNSFIPNRKFYNRVMWALEKVENVKMLIAIYKGI